MRPEKLYLTDIVEAADAIQRFCAGKDYDDFLLDEMCQSAALQKPRKISAFWWMSMLLDDIRQKVGKDAILIS